MSAKNIREAVAYLKSDAFTISPEEAARLGETIFRVNTELGLLSPAQSASVQSDSLQTGGSVVAESNHQKTQ